MDKHRILIVDDDRTILEMLELALSKAGFEVIAAADGDEGLRLFKTTTPDLAIIDVAMPGIDGYEVTERIRQADPEGRTQIVFLTAHDQPVMRSYAQELGAKLYLTKPVIPSRLIEQIRGLLGEKPAL